MPIMNNNKAGGDFHPLIDTVGERQIITSLVDGVYETNVDSVIDGNRCWLFRYSSGTKQMAIKRHHREIAKAQPKIEHPCRCGSLNTRYNICGDFWECPSCLMDRM